MESTFLLPLLVRISRRAASPLSLSREIITTVASSLARPSAVALPMPELAPVIRQTLPVISTLLSSKYSPPSGREVGGWLGIIFGLLDQTAVRYRLVDLPMEPSASIRPQRIRKSATSTLSMYGKTRTRIPKIMARNASASRGMLNLLKLCSEIHVPQAPTISSNHFNDSVIRNLIAHSTLLLREFSG